MTRVHAVQDDESDWYVIPEEEVEEFYACLRVITNEVEHSDEWYNNIDLFENKYRKYATGGDLNLIPLYANI